MSCITFMNVWHFLLQVYIKKKASVMKNNCVTLDRRRQSRNVAIKKSLLYLILRYPRNNQLRFPAQMTSV